MSPSASVHRHTHSRLPGPGSQINTRAPHRRWGISAHMTCHTCSPFFPAQSRTTCWNMTVFKQRWAATGSYTSSSLWCQWLFYLHRHSKASNPYRCQESLYRNTIFCFTHPPAHHDSIFRTMTLKVSISTPFLFCWCAYTHFLSSKQQGVITYGLLHSSTSSGYSTLMQPLSAFHHSPHRNVTDYKAGVLNLAAFVIWREARARL